MSFYGYDPSAYRTDFSRYGSEIGGALSALSSEFTELAKHNKMVKENNKYKEMSYSAVNQYIDELDPEILSNVVSSMGKPDLMEMGEDKARSYLKSRVPKYTDDMKPEDFDVKMATEFFVPFQRAAESSAGGGSLQFGKLYSGLNAGGVTSALEQTKAGSSMLAREAEQKQYETGVAREADKYTLGKERATTEEQESFELGKTRSVESAGVVNNAIQSTATPEEAYQFVVDNGGGEKEADDAFNKKRQLLQDEEEKKKNAQYRKNVIKPEKIDFVDPSMFPDLIREASAAVGSVDDDIAALKAKKKKMNSTDYEQQLAELTREREIAKTNRQNIMNADKAFIKAGGKTKEDAIKARTTGAKMTEAQQLSDKEQEMISDYANGKYRKFFKSRKEEMDNFIADYKEEFGVEPTVQSIEKAIPQFKYDEDSITGTPSGGGKKFVVGGDDKAAKVERAKKALADPKATPTQKRGAKAYLESVGAN